MRRVAFNNLPNHSWKWLGSRLSARKAMWLLPNQPSFNIPKFSTLACSVCENLELYQVLTVGGYHAYSKWLPSFLRSSYHEQVTHSMTMYPVHIYILILSELSSQQHASRMRKTFETTHVWPQHREEREGAVYHQMDYALIDWPEGWEEESCSFRSTLGCLSWRFNVQNQDGNLE